MERGMNHTYRLIFLLTLIVCQFCYSNDHDRDRNASDTVPPANNPPVIKSFTHSKPGYHSDSMVVTFTATATDADGDTIRYIFDFDDGKTVSTTRNSVKHYYYLDGHFDVTVAVTDGKRDTVKKAMAVHLEHSTHQWKTGYVNNPADVGDLKEIMKNMAVYVDLPSALTDSADSAGWPHNEFGEWLSHDEIMDGIRVGLNVVASVLPDFNWRFVDTMPAEGLVIVFIPGSTSFGELPPWRKGSVKRIRMGSLNYSFRRYDFVNSFMRHQYERDYTDPSFNHDSGDWTAIRYYDYFGKTLGPNSPAGDHGWGNKDIATVLMHELLHVLTGGHLNGDNSDNNSPDPTATWRSRFCQREVDPPMTLIYPDVPWPRLRENAYSKPLVFMKLRRNNILNDTSVVSLSNCMSSERNWWNFRIMTDIDADRLATGKCSPVFRESENLSGSVSVKHLGRKVTGSFTRFTTELAVGDIIHTGNVYSGVAEIIDDTHLVLTGPALNSRDYSSKSYKKVESGVYTFEDGFRPLNIDQRIPLNHEHPGYTVTYPKIRSGWRIKMRHRHTGAVRYLDNWHEVHGLLGWFERKGYEPVDNDWFVVDVLNNGK